MCGIVGFIGKSNAIENVEKGLKMLEYRGYDSAGISFIYNNEMITQKFAGSVQNLFNKIKKYPSSTAIGHTRWATHGKATNINAHPHLSENGEISVVHNGIIENYVEIKTSLLKNFNFKSDTDSEVISNLIQYFLIKDNFMEAINKALKLLKGSFALCIIFKNAPDYIFFARNKSPLLIGKNKEEFYIASDILGFSDNAKIYYTVGDNCYGFVNKFGIKSFSIQTNKSQKIKYQNAKDLNINAGLGNKKYYMEKEIFEIKDVLNSALSIYKNFSPLKKIKPEFFNNINRVKIIACGTSYNSGLVGAKIIESALKLDCSTHLASEFIYERPLITKNTLCIFISQSGETADTLSAISIAKKHKAKTLAITNVLTSSIARMCEYALPICAGSEIAVASTKAYNCQILIFYLLASFLKNKNSNAIISSLKNEIKLIDIDLINKEIEKVINIISNQSNIFIVGRNYDYICSLEASLKLKEISYINCLGIASGELKHGSLALIDDKSLVIAYITEKDLIEKTMNVINQIKARGGKVIGISQFQNVLESNVFYSTIKLPSIKEKFMPIFSIIPMQLISYKVSLALGHNPDKPRNLAKSVTVE